MQVKWENDNAFYAAPTEGYEKLSFEEKNAQKYLVTFPYPYMNGYLHLGKLLDKIWNVI